MTLDNKLLEIRCKGRDENSRECIPEYVNVKVEVYTRENQIIGDAICQYYSSNDGRCNAGKGHCPYDFEIPATLRYDKRKHSMQW